MRGHCTCGAPQSFPDRRGAMDELVETHLGIAAAHKVQQLFPLGAGIVTLELVCKFRDRTCL